MLPQVYNTLCRVFPRRFVLPLNIDSQTPFNQNLIHLPNVTATCLRISTNKVGCSLNNCMLRLKVDISVPEEHKWPVKSETSNRRVLFIVFPLSSCEVDRNSEAIPCSSCIKEGLNTFINPL